MLTHVIAHEGCTDTVKESALKADSGWKIPFSTRELNPTQRYASPMLYQLSYSPAPNFPFFSFFFFFVTRFDQVSCTLLLKLYFALSKWIWGQVHYHFDAANELILMKTDTQTALNNTQAISGLDWVSHTDCSKWYTGCVWFGLGHLHRVLKMIHIFIYLYFVSCAGNLKFKPYTWLFLLWEPSQLYRLLKTIHDFFFFSFFGQGQFIQTFFFSLFFCFCFVLVIHILLLLFWTGSVIQTALNYTQVLSLSSTGSGML